MAAAHLTGALGVVDVEIAQRKQWPLLSLLLHGDDSSSSSSSSSSSRSRSRSRSSSLRIARRWGMALEETADGTGAVEVAWSQTAGVRGGDVVLAIDGRLVAGQGLAAVEKLLDEDSPRPLRLTLDTTKGWGVSSRMQQKQQQQQQEGGWCRRAYRWVWDGYERLFDARCCPRSKQALHALALYLLYPLIESAFQSTNTLSKEHGPLVLLPHACLLAFERLWSLAFFGVVLAPGLPFAFACPLRRAKTQAFLAASSANLLCSLLLCLLALSAVVALTVATTGFVLLPPHDPNDAEYSVDGVEALLSEEERLQLLLAHVICAVLFPLLACGYLRRVARFCSAYAALLYAGRNPRLLDLNMPLSAHFVGQVGEERERFLALRASGY